MRFIPRKDKGMTLIEAIVYVAIFSIVMMAILQSVISFYQTNRFTLEQMSQLSIARKGVNVLVVGLRGAKYSASGAYPLEVGGANNVTFFANIDGGTDVERARYFLSGGTLKVGITKPIGSPPVYNPATETITTVADYIRNVEQNIPIFQYYDTLGAVMTVPPNVIEVRFIKINLIVNVNPATMPNEFTLRSSATIRNVKNNL